jgi:hypothetical protein
MPWNASVPLPQLARHDGANEHKQTHDGLMAGMVSTFKGADLKMKK